ncbi:MAG: homoserine kinase [bacterium]
MKKIKLAVPASTSNLGPGFDTLGMALKWPLLLTAEPADRILLEETTTLAGPLAQGSRQALEEVVRAFEKRTGKTACPLKFSFEGDVPPARGLGSSACCRLAALSALNLSNNEPLSENELLEVACELEGHTDNAAASQLGGLTVSGWDRGRIRWIRYPVPETWRFAALIPDAMLETGRARSVLPTYVPLRQAVENMQRMAWLVYALANDRPDLIAGTFHDNLHQPYRKTLLPFLEPVIEAAEEAGAYGAFLSGSGSAVLAVTDLESGQKVADAMVERLRKAGEPGYAKLLEPDNRGTRMIE